METRERRKHLSEKRERKLIYEERENGKLIRKHYIIITLIIVSS